MNRQLLNPHSGCTSAGDDDSNQNSSVSGWVSLLGSYAGHIGFEVRFSYRGSNFWYEKELWQPVYLFRSSSSLDGVSFNSSGMLSNLNSSWTLKPPLASARSRFETCGSNGAPWCPRDAGGAPWCSRWCRRR
ncbi:hypothetical protein HanIR_Chr17g0882331 [Helianthus annuus]|nr:hypothetical protein HanIR_Chr17g0882331 [Helianthus annuus]